MNTATFRNVRKLISFTELHVHYVLFISCTELSHRTQTHIMYKIYTLYINLYDECPDSDQKYLY